MKTRTTMRAAVATGMAAVLGFAGAGSALAAPTTEQLVRAAETMLNRADVPDNIRVSTNGYSFTASEGIDPQPWLCSTNNKVRLGPPAVQQYQLELGDLDLKRDAALQQNLYLYGSVEAAQEAWEKVKTRAARCSGDTRETDGEGDDRYTWKQRLRNGTTQFDTFGVPGLWIHSNSDNKSKDYEFIDDEYIVMYLVGNAIQTLEYDRDYKQNITAAERATLQALGKSLAERWAN
ncbi:MAG TPA: hypothetical protein VGP37_11370 [Candidatus Nanopelagicales bacterium]|nr:hypothetical protein [Candidatus Nanopelagicales bacterium]